MPGSLAINKDARIAPNKDIDPKVLDGKSFESEITIPSAAGKTLTTEVRDAQNERVGEPFDMEFDASGKRRQSLKDEETLDIHGLDAGADYTVTEVKDKMPAGFKQTSAEGDTGKIAAGKTQLPRNSSTPHRRCNGGLLTPRSSADTRRSSTAGISPKPSISNEGLPGGQSHAQGLHVRRRRPW